MRKTDKHLTPRETEVLNLLATGMTNREMANELGITIHTIKAHLESIYLKLDVHNKIQAVMYGIKNGIIKT